MRRAPRLAVAGTATWRWTTRSTKSPCRRQLNGEWPRLRGVVRWASEPVEKSNPPGFDGLGGPSYRLFPWVPPAKNHRSSFLPETQKFAPSSHKKEHRRSTKPRRNLLHSNTLHRHSTLKPGNPTGPAARLSCSQSESHQQVRKVGRIFAIRRFREQQNG